MQAQTKEVREIWTSEIQRLLEAQFTLSIIIIIHIIESSLECIVCRVPETLVRVLRLRLGVFLENCQI